MFIDPIQLMQFGEGFQTTRVSSGTIKDVETLAGQTVFADVFRKAIDDVIAQKTNIKSKNICWQQVKQTTLTQNQ